MKETIEIVTESLTQMSILADVFIVLGVFGLIARNRGVTMKWSERVYRLIEEHGLVLAWLVAFIATAGSLFFSEGAGYEPCKLCWLQRIFMYPLVLILGMAVLKKDVKIAIYALTMSLTGLAIALYHYYVQTSGVEILPCSVTGYAASCVENFVLRYGYVTIVTMSATAFATISLIMSVMLLKKQK